MKRSENFYPYNSKRVKLQQEVDDIWGDDPEIDEVDRCISMATQMCPQDRQAHNTLNMTSYEDFRAKSNIHASTQAFLPPSPHSTSGLLKQENQLSGSVVSVQSSSKVVTTKDTSDEETPKLQQKIKMLESEKKNLTEMYETKNGEITILRSQLKQVQKSVDSEKIEKLRAIQENQQKWDSKINTLNKEINSLGCELDLKNLEIANLREKLTELKKVCHSNMNISILNEGLNGTQRVFKNKINGEIKTLTAFKNIQTEYFNRSYPTASSTIFPLQTLIPETFFEKCHEKNNILKLNGNKNSSPYRHYFTNSSNGNTTNRVLESRKDNLICISNFYPNIQRILKYSYKELNSSREVSDLLDTFLNLTSNSLLILNNQLNKFKEELTYDYIENMNTLHLKENGIVFKSECIFSSNLWHYSETAVEIRRYIAVLSSLVEHSKKLQKYIIISQDVVDNKFKMDVGRSSEKEFLYLLLEIVTTINNVKRSDHFCGLLSAILKLLGNLSGAQILPVDNYEVISQIFKQIIFSHPIKPVLKYVVEFLKQLSQHELFLAKLCNLKKDETTHTIIKDGLLYYSDDTCTVRILATLLLTCEMDICMMSNVMQFLINLLTCNVFWMYHQDEQRCGCLMAVYSLGIDIFFNTTKKLAQLSENPKDQLNLSCHHTIFQAGLIFVDILTARIPDLLVKCSCIFPQYQTIIKYICKIQKRLLLKKDNETALENLTSTLNSDFQNKSQSRKSDKLFNSNITW